MFEVFCGITGHLAFKKALQPDTHEVTLKISQQNFKKKLFSILFWETVITSAPDIFYSFLDQIKKCSPF